MSNAKRRHRRRRRRQILERRFREWSNTMTYAVGGANPWAKMTTADILRDLRALDLLPPPLPDPWESYRNFLWSYRVPVTMPLPLPLWLIAT